MRTYEANVGTLTRLGALILSGTTLMITPATALQRTTSPEVGAVLGTLRNDECQNAELVAIPSDTGGSTLGAVWDDVGDCDWPNTAPGVWYKVTGTGTTLTATTCHQETNYDTKISVYCGDCANPACVIGEDDDNACTYSIYRTTVSWCAEARREYMIHVHGWDIETGAFVLGISDNEVSCSNPVDCPTPPPNDLCVDCIPVTSGVPFNGSTFVATGTDITSCTNNDTADAWNCWTADCTGTATFSLCGSLYDTSLAIFDACGGQELGCDDDSCEFQSELTYAVTAGETYYVRVSGYGGDTGDYTLNARCDPPPGACCDSSTGVCLDSVLAMNCLAPFRFAPSTLCADMNPLCGLPAGACCVAGDCVGVREEEVCLEQGGTWFRDLSCAAVVCPQPPQACCFTGGSCVDTEPIACLIENGFLQGPATTCADTTCVDEPSEACCLPFTGAGGIGTCFDLPPSDCRSSNGTPRGLGTQCEGRDLNGNGADDACDPDPAACCLPDESCVETPVVECRQAGGTPAAPGSVCEGDCNGDGIDDACVELGDINGDRQIDLKDWEILSRCLEGPAVPVDLACRSADLNCDGKVDLKDVWIFQRAFAG